MPKINNSTILSSRVVSFINEPLGFDRQILMPKDAEILQATYLAMREKFQIHTPKCSRDYLENTHMTTSGVKYSKFKGIVSEVKYKNLDGTSRVSAICIMYPCIRWTDGKWYETDSHFWLFMDKLNGSPEEDTTIYIGDTIMFCATIGEYGSKGVYRKGPKKWLLLSSKLLYKFNRKVSEVPSYIKRQGEIVKIVNNKNKLILHLNTEDKLEADLQNLRTVETCVL